MCSGACHGMPLPAERVRLGWGDRRNNLKALASLPAGPGLKSFQGRKLSVRVRSEMGGGCWRLPQAEGASVLWGGLSLDTKGVYFVS